MQTETGAGPEAGRPEPSLPSGVALVVLPTYNEAENVLDVIGKILANGDGWHVLVVDDASPDGTSELVATAGTREPRVHLLRRRAKLGLGSAYLAGFEWALERDYAVVATMDCDHSHDPRDLPRLLAALGDEGIVVGSRYVPGGRVVNWPLHRRFLSRFANAYTRILLRLPVHDCTSGYRCYARRVLEVVDPFSIRASGYAFLEEMVHRVHQAGFPITEVPIVFEERRRGVSKINRGEIVRAAWHVFSTALRRRQGSGGRAS